MTQQVVPLRFFSLLRSQKLRKMSFRDRISAICRAYANCTGSRREVFMVPGFQAPTACVRKFHWNKQGQLYEGGRQKKRLVVKVGKGWLIETFLSVGLNLPVTADPIRVWNPQNKL